MFTSTLLQGSVANIPLAIFLGIVSGVIGKYVYDFYVRYIRSENRDLIKWDWKGFGLIFLLSGFVGLILYGAVFEKVNKLDGFWLIVSAAAQAGFFSQAILGELGKKYS